MDERVRMRTVGCVRARRTFLLLVLCGVFAGTMIGCGSPRYAVGETGPAGGVVFRVSDVPFPCGPGLTERCTYLEVASSGGETVRAWNPDADPERATPGADRSEIGAGRTNTDDAVVALGPDPSNSAAAYAAAYEQNGYDDWYLPSKAELFELYAQREAAGLPAAGTYWSSTDYAFITAWCLDFAEGPLRRRLQTDELRVRPIRAF